METLDNGKHGRRSPWEQVERVVRSTWMVPLLCLAVNVLCVAAITWMGLGRTTLIACLCLIALSFLALALWFIASLFFKQSWGSRVLRLLFIMLVGGVFFCNSGGAQYWHVPEGVDFEVPAGLSVEEDAPDIVQRLAGRTSEHGASEPPSTLPEGDFPTRAANMEKLAQNPAMETVDSLLPLPQTPRLQLAESSSRGIYHLTIWLPKDARRDGHYQIRAFEYNTGTELALDRDPTLKPESGYELANAFVLENPDFMVYTGDWGQYYGSRWQVWFVPNQGEKELVCEQLFLMQGWMR